uniref:Uncharacterized protein n=1 Tax=Leersia perrieri TaxID=77586 RepID=A0A0D9XAL1_9ORYZ
MATSIIEIGDGFTEADLAAADHLVQLSVSGGCEEDDGYCSSSTTLQSVNNAETTAALAMAKGDEIEDEDEDEDDDMGIDRRIRKKYRLLSELYAATKPVTADEEKVAGAGAGGGYKRKKRDQDKKKKKQPRRR